MWMRIVVTLFAILLTVGASMRQERFDRKAEAQRQQPLGYSGFCTEIAYNSPIEQRRSGKNDQYPHD